VHKIGRLTLAILFSLSLLQAEEIQLRDGSKVAGRMVSVNDNVFEVKTAYGVINVPRSEIVAIRFPENGADKKHPESPGADVPVVEESLNRATYVDRTAHFQVELPKGWILAPELRKSPDIVAALTSADKTLFFMVTPEAFAGSLSTYRVLTQTQFQTKFRDYQMLSESEARLDGRTGIGLVFQGKSPDNGIEIKFLVCILPDDKPMVRLSFSTLPPLSDDAVPVFEGIAASYHLTSEKSIAALPTSNTAGW
jgi:hypothetical protein